MNPFFSFLQFDIEESDNCNRDYVEIHRDSAEGPILGHYCGNTIPTNLTAADKLWIKFNSDSANTAGGFIAQYNLRKILRLFDKFLTAGVNFINILRTCFCTKVLRTVFL
jgi:hypothetical protein